MLNVCDVKKNPMYAKAVKDLGSIAMAYQLFNQVESENRKVVDSDIAAFQRSWNNMPSVSSISTLAGHLTGRSPAADYEVRLKSKAAYIRSKMKKEDPMLSEWVYDDGFGNVYKTDDINNDKIFLGFAKVDYTKRLESQKELLSQFASIANRETDLENADKYVQRMYKRIIRRNIHLDANEYMATYDQISELIPAFKKIHGMIDIDFMPLVIYNEKTKQVRFFLISNDDFGMRSTQVHLSRFVTQKTMLNNNYSLTNKPKSKQIFELSMIAIMAKSIDPTLNFGNFTITNYSKTGEVNSFNVKNLLGEIKQIISNPLVMDKMSLEMKQLLQFSEIYNAEYYITEDLYDLNEQLDLIKTRITGSGTEYEAKIDRWIEGIKKNSAYKFIDNSKLAMVLSEIIKSEAERYKFTEGMFLNNSPLFNTATKALYYLWNKKQPANVKMDDISKFSSWILLNHEVANPYMAMAHIRHKEAYYTMLTKLKNKQKRLNDAFVKYYDVVIGGGSATRFAKTLEGTVKGLIDLSAEYFEPMFIKETGYSSVDGKKQLNINTLRIHHSSNPETLEAEKKDPTNKAKWDAIKQFGDVVMALLKETAVEYRFNELKSFDTEDSELLKAATADVEGTWDFSKGYLPVMSKLSSEHRSLIHRFTQDSRSDNFNIEYNEGSEAFTLNTNYMADFRPNMTASDFEFNRNEKLGLYRDESGVLVKKDPKLNDNLEGNIQFLMNYVMGTTIYAQEMNKFVPYYYSAMSLIRNEGMINSKPQLKNLYDYGIKWFRATVQGQRLKLDHKGFPLMGERVTLDDFLFQINNLVTISLTFANYYLDIQNAARNLGKIHSKAIATTLAGNKDLFTEQELIKASSFVASNLNKSMNIAQKYNIDNTDMANVMSSTRHNSSKGLVDNYQLTYGSFLGDYMTSVTLLIAQMIHDGTLDAHDNNGNYDESKDARWKVTDGKLLRDFTYQEMQEAGYGISGNKLTYAYSPREVNRIRVINSKWISGPYSQMDSIALDAETLGKMFQRFKRYLSQDIFNALSLVEKELIQLGKPEVAEVEVDGKKQKIVVVKPVFEESKLKSLIRTLAVAKSVNSDGYKTFKQLWEDDRTGLKYRENIFKIQSDLILGIVPLLFLSLVRGDKDDKDDSDQNWIEKTRKYYLSKERSFLETVLFRTLWFGVSDTSSDMNPTNYINATIDPFVAFKNFSKMYNAAAFALRFEFDKAGNEVSRAISAKKYIYDKIFPDGLIEEDKYTVSGSSRIK